jgi:hypothetical protein
MYLEKIKKTWDEFSQGRLSHTDTLKLDLPDKTCVLLGRQKVTA